MNVPTDHPFRAAPLRLVVADDDKACRLTSSLLLRGAGFEVVEAENATEVLSAVASGNVSLVLADIHMPGNERLELVRDLHQKCPGLPVLLFTGFASTETAIQSLNAGVVAYLQKPVRADELLDAVQRAAGLYETRRVVSRSLEQLRSWTGDLERLEQQMNDPRNAAHSHAVGSYLDLSLRRIMASVGDLSEVIDVLARSPGGASGMRTHELEVAVREAIGVLERTKRDFKSKELAELRLRLERVAGDSTTPQASAQVAHVTQSELRIDAGRAATSRG